MRSTRRSRRRPGRGPSLSAKCCDTASRSKRRNTSGCGDPTVTPLLTTLRLLEEVLLEGARKERAALAALQLEGNVLLREVDGACVHVAQARRKN